jgi:lipopolysaccharide export system protein LptA
MARWQRHARLGLGLFAVTLAGVTWATMRSRPEPVAPIAITRLDEKATSEIHGGDVLQHKGTKRDISVEFGSQISYADGRSQFTSFKAHVDDRGGRSFVISGQKARVGPERATYDVEGNVKLETSDGLTVTTPQASFTEAEGVVRGPGPVQFTRGRTTGSGVGFTYDRTLDRLALLDRAVINVAPAPDGAGAMHVTAGAANYSRAERFMRFERNMHMERQGQVIDAGDSTVFLLRDRDEPEHVELRNGSRISGAAGTGSLQAMQARDINLRYAPDGRTLEQAVLSGQSGIDLGRPENGPPQQLRAETIDTSLAPDGAVTRLLGRTQPTDPMRVSSLTLPANAERAARTITAPTLEGSGEAGRGLTTIAFDGGVEYREEAAQGGSSRAARARTLKTALGQGGALDEAVFAGGFRFEEGKLVATSVDATYQVTKGSLALRGGSGATRPHAQDERVSVDGNTIDVTLTPREMRAAGAVHTELAPGRRQAGERGTSLLDEKEAVVVNAESVVFEEATAKGVYKGQAHLLQSSGTTIRADEITMDEKQGILTAVGNMRSVLRISGPQERDSKAMSIAKAADMTFDDAKRQIVLTKNAELDGVQGNLKAARIEMYLAAKANTMDRLEAQDSVTVVLDKRTATGQRMTYHPTDEMYVLTGTPVRLVQECQESTGRTLTFYKASEKVSVDGAEEIRTQTKGGKCPDTR